MQVAQASTVGFHLSAESITIDLDRTSLGMRRLPPSKRLANDAWANHPVTARIVQPDDAEGVRIRKLPEHILTGGLRVVDIDGFDVTACGGTHVAHTGEIGLIKILRLEKRGDKTRVEFRCGARALRDYREKNAIANQLTADLTCALPEVPQAVARLQDDFKAEQRALKAANGQLIEYEALRLAAETPLANGVRIITQAFTNREFGDLRILAARLAQEADGCAAGDQRRYETGKAQLVFARSASLPHDMNVLLAKRWGVSRMGAAVGAADGAGRGTASPAIIREALAAAAQSISG